MCSINEGRILFNEIGDLISISQDVTIQELKQAAIDLTNQGMHISASRLNNILIETEMLNAGANFIVHPSLLCHQLSRNI